MALNLLSSTPPWRSLTWPEATAKGEQEDETEMASTRLSLEQGKVGIQSSPPCSSSSSAGHPTMQPAATATAAPGYGPRPRHMLTERPAYTA
uniref:Uncharacterized protein n=1 Tax=Oryza nivara TaxID=4536 RepID=A0A0E0G8S6_ORYNI